MTLNQILAGQTQRKALNRVSIKESLSRTRSLENKSFASLLSPHAHSLLIAKPKPVSNLANLENELTKTKKLLAEKMQELRSFQECSERALFNKSEAITRLESQLNTVKADSDRKIRSLTSQLEFQSCNTDSNDPMSPTSKLILMSQSPKSRLKRPSEDKLDFLTPTKRQRPSITSSPKVDLNCSKKFSPPKALHQHSPSEYVFFSFHDLTSNLLVSMDTKEQVHSALCQFLRPGSADAVPLLLSKLRLQLFHALEKLLLVESADLATRTQLVREDVLLDRSWAPFFERRLHESPNQSCSMHNDSSHLEESYVTQEDAFAGAPLSQMPSAILPTPSSLSTQIDKKTTKTSSRSVALRNATHIQNDLLISLAQFELLLSAQSPDNQVSSKSLLVSN
ncbi:hypothetical protein Ciccas_011058 [Cichlidogyrus casuarinus]|uniref:Uncharacterized protein n=1 Tax=Cichlidogyrus casuarinus TaxID=1844966 RepID=A0ABD2PSD6_9PLAT